MKKVTFTPPVYCKPVVTQYMCQHNIECDVKMNKTHPYKTILTFKSDQDELVFVLMGMSRMIKESDIVPMIDKDFDVLLKQRFRQAFT